MNRQFISLGVTIALVGGILLFVSSTAGQQSGKPTPAAASSQAVAAPISVRDDESLRLDGEKRFRANCGRCHQSPHKFPPRMMATILRHMRVRATITDEDMRAILAYMTQ
jgi:mono/diheme cytochrome c family protein